MKSYQDELWVKSKKLVKESSGDLDIILTAVCYRDLGGKNIFVYASLDSGLNLIYDLADDDHIVVVSKDKQMYLADYTTVFKARKIIRYSESPELVNVSLDKDCQQLMNETEIELYMEGGSD